LRAVRSEGYRPPNLAGVQQAGAKARWTGSWLSVCRKSIGAFSLSAELRAEVQVLDGVQQVGREFLRDPRYLNLDLEIEICVQPSYPGQVQERVIEALTIRRPACKAESFTRTTSPSGHRCARTALRPRCRPLGVLAVEEIRLRARRLDWRVFEENVFAVSDDQILRLQNDPRFPDRGSLWSASASMRSPPSHDSNRPPAPARGGGLPTFFRQFLTHVPRFNAGCRCDRLDFPPKPRIPAG
jgi:hypothetical protein